MHKPLTVLWLILLYFVTCCVPPVQAYYAPLQDVQAWVDADGRTVRFKVLNPVTASWEEGSYTDLTHSTVENLQVTQGIVTWLTYGYHGCAVYDPAAGWMVKDLGLANTMPTVKDGIVRSGFGAGTNGHNFYVYDPAAMQWRSWGYGATTSGFDLIIQDGVVATNSVRNAPGSYVIYYSVYDPAIGWVIGAWPNASGGGENLAITNGTVTWQSGGVNYTRGYDPATRSWYAGPSKPFAAFAAQHAPSPPNIDRTGWFTDLSFLGTSFHWDFGDGGTSDLRSTYHTYKNNGSFPVTQALTGPAGNATTTQVIKVADSSSILDFVPAFVIPNKDKY
jgi:hypothetical protein